MTTNTPFQNCIDHARRVDSTTLLPVIVDGSHGAILLSNLEKLQDCDNFGLLLRSGHLQLASDRLIACAGAQNPSEISDSLQVIAGLLHASKIIPENAAWDEKCRVVDNWEWEKTRGLKLPYYKRAIRGFFGFAYFATNLVPYYRDAQGETQVILAVSAKKNSAGETKEKFDLIGGNIPFDHQPGDSMRKEAAEETTGGLALDRNLYSAAYNRYAVPFFHSLRMTKVEGDKVLNGNRRLYKIEIPAGAEKNWQPQAGEISAFRAVPLKALLAALQSNDETSEYALSKFKHNVPISLVAFALRNSLIRQDASLEAELDKDYAFPASARISLRAPVGHQLGKLGRDKTL